jgi:uncharacterized protein (TIGR00730 family)
MTEKRVSIFPPADFDAKRAEKLPETPQTRSPSFRLAFRDADFLEQNELRPVRLQLELLKLSHYYDEARKFAHLVGAESVRRQGTEYVVCTGGGPGVMEAGSQGAHEAGADTIGLGIVLPREEAPNAYVTPELSFNFHYFAIRKMHFLMRARAVAVFPGGFGTLDELFETLTLIQTARMEPIPVLLFGRDFVETAEEGWEIICDAEGIDA